MRLFKTLLCLAGLAQAVLPTASALAAAAPSRDGAQDMMRIYEDFCLSRFPNAAQIKDGVDAQHLPPASAADRAQAMLGTEGDAWAVVTPQGRFVLTVAQAAHQGCAVIATVLNDEGTRAAFDIMVSMYASAHEFGALSKLPLRHGMVGGKPAVMQLIGAVPDGRPRQAFVNLAVPNPDGTALSRMTREFAPAGPQATPAPHH